VGNCQAFEQHCGQYLSDPIGIASIQVSSSRVSINVRSGTFIAHPQRGKRSGGRITKITAGD